MTIGEAINRVNEAKPNAYTDSQKVGWLAELDGIIKREVMDKYIGGNLIGYTPYTDNTDKSTDLLVEAPYDGLYPLYLGAMIDFYDEEYEKYDNSIALYHERYIEWLNDYNQRHKPIQRQFYI